MAKPASKGSGEAEPVSKGLDKMEPTPLGLGKARAMLWGSDEAVVMPLRVWAC
jgi:hypothetical protein